MYLRVLSLDGTFSMNKEENWTICYSVHVNAWSVDSMKTKSRKRYYFFLTFKPTCASYLITILPQKHIIKTMLHDYTLVYYVFTSCHIFFRSETFISAVLTLSSLNFAISLAFSYSGDTMLSQSAINLSKNLKCNAVCLKKWK